MDEDSDASDDEFSGKGLVFDSDEEEDGITNENLTADKRKVQIVIRFILVRNRLIMGKGN